MAIPAGEYEVKIKLTDDNAKGQEESEWTLSIKVFGISTKYTNVDKVEEDFSGRVFVLESYEGDASGNNELSVSDVIENLNDEFETKVKI